MSSVVKQPGESILYDMDMSSIGRLATSDNISTVVSVIPSSPDVTVSSISHDSNYTAQFRLSGGLPDRTYYITVRVMTAAGDVLEGDGTLVVQEILG